MNKERPPAKSRFLAVLCCIAAVVLPVVFMGCQGVTEPQSSSLPNGQNGSLSEARTTLGLSVEAGPIVTVTNEYMDPVVSPRPGAYMRIPDGVPLTFCWTAKKVSGGAEIEAYRYGWDVIGPGDPSDWDVEFTEYDGSRVCSSPRSFSAVNIHFFSVEVIDDAGASSRINIIINVVKGPSSFDVMPGSCKNPFNAQRKGPVRTAIPGRVGLEVSEIDVSSLYLWIDGNTVEPLRTRVQDITSPMINRDPCDCPLANADGIDDLVIFFASADIIRAMGVVSKGETRELSIRGALLDGHNFALNDCVVIVGNPRTGDDPALFQKDAVLVTLQKAYNAKDFHKVSVLFDSEFTFFFSEADIQNGYVPYAQWGRDDELAATAKLFNVDNPADALAAGSIGNRLRHVGTSEGATVGRVKAAFFDGLVDGQTSINLLVIFPQGEESWVAVTPPDPVQYEGEVWYRKTAMYFMTVQVGDMTYITDGLPQTSFVVRFSETKGHWQLVQWRDDI